MTNFQKILYIGKRNEKFSGKIFIQIKYKNKKLSITGVEGPLINGNCTGSCGQILSVLKSNLVFAKKWNTQKALKLYSVWDKWHLNNMQAGCIHQRKANWEAKRIDPKELKNLNVHKDKNGIYAIWVTPKEHTQGLLGVKCPTCGYKYGSAWLHMDVPESILVWLQNLPESNIIPAWI